jgi:hypothetical protein
VDNREYDPVRMVLDSGADTNAQSDNNQTLEEVAKEKGFIALQKISPHPPVK